MKRRQLVEALERLAFAAEIEGDRRARALSSAAWAIRQVDDDPRDLVASGKLSEVKGVGPKTAQLVSDLLDGIRPKVAEELEAKVPAGLFELRRIKGLGPKKIATLFRELGIASLGELEHACGENRLVHLAGFGAKTQSSVLEQIHALQASAHLRRRDQARALIAPLVVEGGVVTGGLPRGLELVSLPIELVATKPTSAAVPEGVVWVVVPAERLGVEVLERTSSPEHLEALRERAEARGVAWSTLEAPNEDAVYAALGLLPTPPERREPGVPLVLEGSTSPRLIRRSDLRGALHNHTVASDGSATLEAMRAAATERGLEYLGITEHSVSAFYARGLDVERLEEQRRALEALEGTPGCALIAGVESDILEDGSLDYPDEVLATLPVVVASVHRRFGLDRDATTARLVAAAKNPRTTIVGHPTGRLLLSRPANDFDVEALLDACAQSGCAIELNASPHRLDLCAEHLAMAKARGVLVSIGADAHATVELDNLEHGIAVARRAGLGPNDVLNTRSLDELRGWLAERRA
ncbi:MAG: helix-hairpin-helix domain-containing protein [Polyangiales bacterium]